MFAQNPHESGKTNQIDGFGLDPFHQGLFVAVSVWIRFGIQENAFETMFVRPFQGIGIFHIADHQGNFSRQIIFFNTVDNGLQIRASSGNQNSENKFVGIHLKGAKQVY